MKYDSTTIEAIPQYFAFIKVIVKYDTICAVQFKTTQMHENSCKNKDLLSC